ncbi:MAG: hypothetical protein ABIX01_01065 [Chitinophagaceae bacterium]
MQKFFVLSFVLIVTSTASFAKIWRVNNTPGIIADFTTAQAAHNGAADGDTIHLEPSITAYGGFTATKRLIWISTGAFLGSHPGEQFSLTPGRLNSFVSFNNGSQNSVFSADADNTIDINTSNIRVERSYIIGQVNLNSGSNSVVINCYIAGGMSVAGGSNHIITNNIVNDFLSVSAGASAVITNNVFNAVSAVITSVYNSTLQNNIFNKTTATIPFNNCIVENNMSGAPNVLPAGNNNQNNISMSSVFINNSGITDGDFVLKIGSPAIGAGTGTPAVDLGAYGGPSPFKFAVQAAIPAIYKITAPAAPAGNTMNVTFSTKSNN